MAGSPSSNRCAARISAAQRLGEGALFVLTTGGDEMAPEGWTNGQATGRVNGHTYQQRGTLDRAKLAADLRAILKHSDVVDQTAELQTYGYDASFLTQLNPIPPDVAVIVRAAEDAAAVMRYAD